MSTSLQLIPFNVAGDFAYSYARLNIDQDYGLYEKLGAIETAETEAVGLPAREFVLASDLTSIDLGSKASAQRLAAWAYLKNLPPMTKVALYWY